MFSFNQFNLRKLLYCIIITYWLYYPCYLLVKKKLMLNYTLLNQDINIYRQISSIVNLVRLNFNIVYLQIRRIVRFWFISSKMDLDCKKLYRLSICWQFMVVVADYGFRDVSMHACHLSIFAYQENLGPTFNISKRTIVFLLLRTEKLFLSCAI